MFEYLDDVRPASLGLTSRVLTWLDTARPAGAVLRWTGDPRDSKELMGGLFDRGYVVLSVGDKEREGTWFEIRLRQFVELAVLC